MKKCLIKELGNIISLKFKEICLMLNKIRMNLDLIIYQSYI